MAEDLPSASLREQDEITAAQHYCTALVENQTHIAKIPKFAKFMESFRESKPRLPDEDVQVLEESEAARRKGGQGF